MVVITEDFLKLLDHIVRIHFSTKITLERCLEGVNFGCDEANGKIPVDMTPMGGKEFSGLLSGPQYPTV